MGEKAEPKTAREEAEKALSGRASGQGGQIMRTRGIGWAILDLADAIREHGQRERLMHQMKQSAGRTP